MESAVIPSEEEDEHEAWYMDCYRKI